MSNTPSAKPDTEELVSSRPDSDRRRLIGGVVLIATATLLCYTACLPGEFLWDDNEHFVSNTAVQSWSGIWDIWFKPGATINYFPLTFTSFWLQTKVFGDNPAGYRLLNIALHIANSVLIWRLLRRLAAPGAFVISLLFALHPVHVQSVAWITELKNTQSVFFFMLATAAYLRFQPPEADAAPPTHPRRWYAAAIALFACAILSKSNMAIWVTVAPIILWWKRGGLQPRDFAPLVPFVPVGAAMAFFTVLFHRWHFQAVGEVWWSYTLPERLILAGRACWFYVGKMLWPNPLIFLYPQWSIDAGSPIQFFWPISFAVFLFVLWLLRRCIGRGPFAAMLFFFVTVFPALGFFNIYGMRYSQVYDYFQYPASLGVIMLVVGTIATLIARIETSSRIGPIAAAAVCIALGITTFNRASIYRDIELLWHDTLEQNPDAWLASNNLSNILLARGEFAEALKLAQQAARSAPHVPEIHSNLGAAHYGLGDLPRAAKDFEKALELRPRWLPYLTNHALILTQLNRPDEAAAQLRVALDIDPGDINTRLNLALLLIKIHKPGDAARLLRDVANQPTAPLIVGITLAQALIADGARDEGNAILRDLEQRFRGIPAAMHAIEQVRQATAPTTAPATKPGPAPDATSNQR